MKSMKVFLTGATGFIGSHVLDKLLAAGHTVALSLQSSSTDTSRIAHALSRTTCCYLDRDNLSSFLLDFKPDAVVHLATLYRKDDVERERVLRSNVLFPSQLLDAASAAGTCIFVNTGTFFEYKHHSDGLVTRASLSETSPLLPFNYYAATKLAFQNLLEYACRRGLIGVTLRLFSPYGPRDNPKLIPHLISSFRKGIPVDMTPGEQCLDFTYVEDIASAFVLALEYCQNKCAAQKNLGLGVHSVFNIGTGKAHSLRDVVAVLESLLSVHNLAHFGAVSYRPDEMMFSQANISAAEQELGWSPSTSLREGLQKTIKSKDVGVLR